MDLDQATTLLESRGFVVWRRSWTMGDPTLQIIYPLSALDGKDANGDITINRDVSISWIYFDKDHWGFHKWDCVPGPGFHDMHYDTNTLDEAMTVLLDYYFGEPVFIDGWILPQHKHPEWSLERLTEAVKGAKNVNEEEWHSIEARYIQIWREIPRSATLATRHACLFATFSHAESIKAKLALRRDLGEAFIVNY